MRSGAVGLLSILVLATLSGCSDAQHAPGDRVPDIITIAGGGPTSATATAISQTPAGLALDGHTLYVADNTNDDIWAVDLDSGTEDLVAGTSTPGYAGDGRPARNARFNGPTGLAVDRYGDLFVADTDDNRIREIRPGADGLADGTIPTVAGNGPAGSTGDGGLAAGALLDAPEGVAVDSAGDLFIADTDSNRIREVRPGADGLADGTITGIAGSGAHGYSGDGGPAQHASLAYPEAIAVGPNGDLYVADTDNSAVREVQPGARGFADATISTVVGNGVAGFIGDGGTPITAELNFPDGLAIGPSGNLLVADDDNSVVRDVSPGVGGLADGTISTVVGVASRGEDGEAIGGFAGDGGPANRSGLQGPTGLVVDPSGDLYIADTGNNRVRKVRPTETSPLGLANGTITTMAGDGATDFSGDRGPSAASQLDAPASVAVDQTGDLFIADTDNERVREVHHGSGTITTVAGDGLAGFSGDGGPATDAELDGPTGLAVGPDDTLYIACETDNRIRRVDLATGSTATVAGDGLAGFSGDGGPATDAELDGPTGLAVGNEPDGSGGSRPELLIADTGNDRIRQVDLATGSIATVAGTGTWGYGGDGGPATDALLADPGGVAVDAAGNLSIADTDNDRIREVIAGSTGLADGTILTVAGTGTPGTGGNGGPATGSELSFPTGVAVGPDHTVLVADKDGNRIQSFSATTDQTTATVAVGPVTTVAGTGGIGFSGDGGPASEALLNDPTGVAVDGNGTTYVADGDNGRVRAVTAIPAAEPSGPAVTVTASAARNERSAPAVPPALTSSPTGAVPPLLTTGPASILVAGDSVALTLGVGLVASGAATGLSISNGGMLGCGIAPSGPFRWNGITVPLSSTCVHWEQTWHNDVDSTRPDSVAVLLGRWEVVDRQFHGQWAHIGQPAFDAYLAGQLQAAIAIASSGGAGVSLLTMPAIQELMNPAGNGVYPETDPLRVDLFNAMLHEVAETHRSGVAVVDLDSLLCPGDHYTLSVGGVVARWALGAHITVAGGEMVAPTILPDLALQALVARS